MTTAAYDDFASDSLARPVWLWNLYPRDADGNEVELLYATEPWTTPSTDTPAIATYEPRVAQGLNYGVRTFPARTSARTTLEAGGELRLLQRAGDLDYLGNTDAYLWDGARAICRHGGYSPKLGRRLLVTEMAILFDGFAEKFDPGITEAKVLLRPLDAALSSPFESRRHRGNSWSLDMTASTYVGFGAAGVPSKVALTGAMSLDFVVYFDSAGMGTIRRLIGWDHTATTYPFQVRVNSSNQLIFRDNATVYGTSTFAFTSGRRYWVGITFGAGTMRFYFLDLVTMTPTLETFTVSTSTRPSPDGLFRIGHASAGHDGMIDQIRIWNAAKTPNQMRQLRLRPMTTAELTASDLKLALLCDEASGSTCTDSAPSAANGTITGTSARLSSLEGGAELAGKPKVNSFGDVPHMEPRFVGLSGTSSQPTFQLHADEITNGKLTIYEGGISAPTLGTAYTDPKLFLTTATLSGKFDVLRSRIGSFIRTFTNPTLSLGATFHGDAADGTYRTKAGELAKYWVTTRGDDPLPSGDVDSAAFTALDTACPGENGIVFAEEVTVGDATERMLSGVGANSWTNRVGAFTVARLADPAVTADWSLDERDIIDLRPLPLGVPISRATVLHRRNFHVLELDQVAGSATAAQRIFATEEWTRASYRDATIADLHPRSEELVIESYLINMSKALEEASRQLGLHGVERRMWECVSRIRHPEMEPMETLELSLSLPSLLGAAAQRLAFPARFVILGYMVSGSDNRMSTYLWG